jgi:hypothetical protein
MNPAVAVGKLTGITADSINGAKERSATDSGLGDALLVRYACTPKKRVLWGGEWRGGGTTMDRTTTVLEWKYGVLWALANAVGWSVAMGILYFIGLVPSGIVIGLVQWLVLARRFSRCVWWILAYGFGWYLGLLLGFHFGFIVPDFKSMGATGGICVGVLQWLMLRRRLHRSVVWVPANTVSSLVGCWVGVVAGYRAYDYGTGEFTAFLVGGAVAGAVIGVLSGIALVWLLKNQSLKQTPLGVRSSAGSS